MINKIVGSAAEAIQEIPDGATVMIGGFGEAGSPIELIHALIDQGAKDLTVISNNTGSGHVGLAALIENRQVTKTICSFPRTANSKVFPELYHAGEIELELVPQGTLAERIRAGGAGIPAFYTPAGYGTEVAEGKETRNFNGKMHVLEHAFEANFAFVKAWKGDEAGNLIFKGTARNFNPCMCGAAKITVAEVEELLPAGSLDPNEIHIPGIFVQRIFQGEHYEKRIEQRTVRSRN